MLREGVVTLRCQSEGEIYDFSTQEEAEEHLLPGDPYGLDADSDGIACEDNPCPCSYSPGGGEEPGGGGGGHAVVPPPAPPAYHLPRAAAERAARKVTRVYVRRAAQVSAGRVQGCRRLGERRIDCLAIARGRTAAARTACQLRTAVRGKNRRPKARLESVNCHTRNLRLTAARALAALKQAALELAGHRVPIEALERISLIAFRGYAEWTRQAHPGQEECFALLEAKRADSGRVTTQPLETACEPVPTA
jgi:hypothetical protein